MLGFSYSISPKDLWNAIATPQAPQIVDVRWREIYQASPGLLQRGFLVYDALFAWLRFAAEERHNWPLKVA